LREGIVDFEKIRILKEKAASSKDTRVKDLVNQLDQQLKIVLDEKAFDSKKLMADVDHGRRIVDQLTDVLTGVVVKGF